MRLLLLYITELRPRGSRASLAGDEYVECYADQLHPVCEKRPSEDSGLWMIGGYQSCPNRRDPPPASMFALQDFIRNTCV